jgi:ABC-type sugar transport system ATPase subunit
MVEVELQDVVVRKGDASILNGVDLRVEPGTMTALVGASGSGKTSVIRAVAGLDEVASGRVTFDGVDVTDRRPADRGVAVVFQRPALYPHLTVGDNIGFPLRIRHDHVDEIRRRVGAEARAMQIESLLTASPRRLSAGEAQVVQVARAIVRNPTVLLLDEPFAHIDGPRADQLRREVQLIRRGFGVTTILATNDPLDAMAFSDRIAVIERGAITQEGSPLDVYEQPRTAAAALLTGDADVIEVGVEGDADGNGSWIVHPGFRLHVWRPGMRQHHARRLQMVVRPEWWQPDADGPVRAVVERVIRLGTVTSLWCRVGDRPTTIKLAGSVHGRLREGDVISLRLDRYVLLDPLDGYALAV